MKPYSEFYKRADSNSYRSNCISCVRQSQKTYENTEKGKKIRQTIQKRFRKSDTFKEYLKSEKVKLANKTYQKNRRAEDLEFKIRHNLRTRLTKFITGRHKTGSAVQELGCSISEFKAYLESKFQPGMTWENYGKEGWHIDHIIPLSYFDLSDRNQFLKACNYSNLQPLWAEDNYSKGKKVHA